MINSPGAAAVFIIECGRLAARLREDRNVTCSLHVAWDDKLTGYDFGPGHPLAPIRIKLTMELARAFGGLSQDEVTVAEAAPASDAELGLIHDPAYIPVVKAAGALAAGNEAAPRPSAAPLLTSTLPTADAPPFPPMHHA